MEYNWRYRANLINVFSSYDRIATASDVTNT